VRIRHKRAVFEPRGTVSNIAELTENHGVPGSNPGLATSIL
jgi:hypothetical protein